MKLDITYKLISECNGKTTTSTTKSTVLLEQKSLLVAYLLWFFGGFFGLHHLYLRRDGHAFFMFCTLGGYLGFGWITDAFCLPEYVNQFNTDALYQIRLPADQRPLCSSRRLHSQLTFGIVLGWLTHGAIPQEFRDLLHWTIPLSISLGVWIIGNIPRHCGVWWHCGMTAIISYIILFYLNFTMFYAVPLISLISSLTFLIFSMQWRRNLLRFSLPLRLLIFALACSGYLLLWWSFFYYNAYLTDIWNRRIPLRVLINHLLKSDWWKDLKLALNHIYKYGFSGNALMIYNYERGLSIIDPYAI